MAAKRDIDNMADMLSCQVCFEEFEEIGSHIPRIFPCSHTVCEYCLKDLIKNDTIVCPECRKKHRAENKEKSFPQNKYLLAQIKGNDNAREEQRNNDRCEKHGERLVLYCLEDTCQKSICISCMVDHNKHDVVGDKEREVLRRKVVKIMKNMEAKVNIISKAKKNVLEKTDKCVKELKDTKEEIVKRIDEMVDQAERQRNEINDQTEKEVSMVTEEIKRLSNILQNLQNGSKISPETLADHHKAVDGIMKNSNKHAGHSCFQYPVFRRGAHSTEEMLGRMTKGEVTVLLPEGESGQAEKTENQLPRRVTNASQLKWTGTSVTFVFCHEVKKVLWHTLVFRSVYVYLLGAVYKNLCRISVKSVIYTMGAHPCSHRLINNFIFLSFSLTVTVMEITQYFLCIYPFSCTEHQYWNDRVQLFEGAW